MARRPRYLPLTDNTVFLLSDEIEAEIRRQRRLRWRKWATWPLRALLGLLIGMLRVFMKVFGPRP